MVQAHALMRLAAALMLVGTVSCGASDVPPSSTADGSGGEGGVPSPTLDAAAYASSVESLELGEGAGYNEDRLPDVVLGPPRGGGQLKGSLDVLSLGSGGEIVLGFGDRGVVDRPGPDLIVFENAFWPEGDASQVFAELGEISVSEDGELWHDFACDTEGDGEGRFPGCAGVTPTLVYDAEEVVALDPERTGGDAFDLADVGVSRARFVRVRDLRTLPPAGNASGFDLDAVGLIHPD